MVDSPQGLEITPDLRGNPDGIMCTSHHSIFLRVLTTGMKRPYGNATGGLELEVAGHNSAVTYRSSSMQSSYSPCREGLGN